MSEALQGNNPDWIFQRLGRVTASRVHDVVATTKSGGWTAQRDAYASELVTERLTGKQFEGYIGWQMKRGLALQEDAVRDYELYRECDVTAVGFVPHPQIAMSGCSPDGLVEHNRLVEFKCPMVHTHLETVARKRVPAAYYAQCQWQLACHPGRTLVDFVSFCPELPMTKAKPGQGTLRLFVQTLERDETWIYKTEQEVIRFLAGVDNAVELICREWGVSPAISVVVCDLFRKTA